MYTFIKLLYSDKLINPEIFKNHQQTMLFIKFKPITTFDAWKESFTNSNTGNKYEIVAGYHIIKDNNLDTTGSFPNGFKGEMNTKYYIDGLLGIINLTQNDNIGGTGDIGFVFKKKIEYWSVTQDKHKLSKCMCNPSSKVYNIKKEDFSCDLDNAYEKSIKEKKTKYGDPPNKEWKRKTDENAKELRKKIAENASKNWNNMPEKSRIKLLKKFLDINNNVSNSNGIIYSSETGITKMYTWKKKINFKDYLETKPDNYWICHYNKKTGKTILKTQVKCNNGLVELPSRKIPEEKWKVKKGDPFGSWNVNAIDLETIFDMKEFPFQNNDSL